MRILFDLPNLEAAAEYLIADDAQRFKDVAGAKEFVFDRVREQNIRSKPTYEQRGEPFMVYKGLQALPSEGVTGDHPDEPTVWVNLYIYPLKSGISNGFVALQ